MIDPIIVICNKDEAEFDVVRQFFEGRSMECDFYFTSGKPSEEELLTICRQIEEKQGVDNSEVKIVSGSKTFRLRRGEIIRAEHENRYTYVVTNSTRIRTSMTIDETLELLGGRPFVKVHKSYIVNYDYVKNHNRDEVLLLDGCRIPISRKHQNRIKDDYRQYLDEIFAEQ